MITLLFYNRKISDGVQNIFHLNIFMVSILLTCGLAYLSPSSIPTADQLDMSKCVFLLLFSQFLFLETLTPLEYSQHFDALCAGEEIKTMGLFQMPRLARQ